MSKWAFDAVECMFNKYDNVLIFLCRSSRICTWQPNLGHSLSDTTWCQQNNLILKFHGRNYQEFTQVNLKIIMKQK